MSPALWLLLQLTDAAFPAGGFVHSSGLEAALHFGIANDLDGFVDQICHQTGRVSLPFVRAACAEPWRLAALDDTIDAMLLSHVGNRASRAQGRAFVAATRRIFDEDSLAEVVEHASRGPAHHAPIFGAVLAALGRTPDAAAIAFLHGAVRGALSAAVRLGAIGPLEAQRLQAERAPLLERILVASSDIEVADAAQTAPLVELFGALHDRLDGRLFHS
jgi:urease accessory protein